MEIVGGIIMGQKRQILVAKRPPKAGDPHASSCWEFPGGKVEAGETHEEALYRELQEELAIRIQDPQFIATTQSPDGALNLHLYRCFYQGNILPLEHKALAWTTLQTLGNFELCPTDRRFVTEQLPSLSEKLMTPHI